MKTVGKLTQTASEEHISWRQELHKCLLAWRATPHPMTEQVPYSSTGAITRPVYLLPLKRPFWCLTKRSENRTKAEAKMKEYADN